MDSKTKKMVIEVDAKDLETLQVMFGVKPEGELIQMAVKSFTGLLNLNKQVQAQHPILNSPQPIVPRSNEVPSAKVYTPNNVPMVPHSDKSSDGKPIVERHDSTGKPLVENMLLNTDPKSIPPEIQKELERMKKNQEAKQKQVLSAKNRMRPQSRGGMVGG